MPDTRFSPRTLTHPAIASALVALALTILLYGDALALPLFSDDLVQIPWLESVSWRELWSTPSPYGDHRPLWFILWRIWNSLAGRLRPLDLHLFNLLSHAIATWLVGLLAATWAPRALAPTGRAIPACLAAILFAVFPFSRQAVSWASALSYPLATALMLGTVVAYIRARRRSSPPWFILSLALAALAPLAYETGLLAPALVVLAEGVGRLYRHWSRSSWWPVAHIALLAAEFVIWRALWSTDSVVHGLTQGDLWDNASFTIQSLIFPVAPLSQLVFAPHGLNSALALWPVALFTLALLIWSGLRQRQYETLALGVGWLVLTALPPLVMRKGIGDAPRLLYPAAVGIALLWTATLGGWLGRTVSYRGLLLAAALMALICTPSILFIRRGMRLYRMAGESIWNAADVAAREQPVLLVNLPMRLIPRSRTYPLGFEGITPLPPRVTADDLVYVHTGIHDAAEAVAFGVVAGDAQPGYIHNLFGQPVGWEELATAARQARTVYLAQYEPERIHLLEAGAASETTTPDEPLARFGDRVALLDAACTWDETGQVRLTIYWQVEAPVKTDATVFAHLLNPDGTLASQADGHPLLGMRPFWLWEPGEVMRDVRHFDAPQPGEYTVALGITDPSSGERLPATAADGSSWPDQIFRTGPCTW